MSDERCKLCECCELKATIRDLELKCFFAGAIAVVLFLGCAWTVVSVEERLKSLSQIADSHKDGLKEAYNDVQKNTQQLKRMEAELKTFVDLTGQALENSIQAHLRINQLEADSEAIQNEDPMPKRVYTNGEINVLWDSDLCIHCEACSQGLPQVFRPKERPWVAINAAPTEQIVDQVGQCPSGALRIKRAENSEVKP